MEKAQYDMECEATCRIMINFMLIECRLASLELLDISPGKKASVSAEHSHPVLGRELRASDNFPVWSLPAPGQAVQGSANKRFLAKSGGNDDSSPSTSGGATPGSAEEGVKPSTPPPAYAFDPQTLTIYPELDMSVEIEDARNPAEIRKLRVSGKADWAFAYGDRQGTCLGNVLIAVGARSRATFSGARSTLLTYLAIMQRLRLQHDRVNLMYRDSTRVDGGTAF